jgi:hypothetical protein
MHDPELVGAPRPVLRALVCRYVEGRWIWDLVPLTHWDEARDEYLTAGWWFVALDPGDDTNPTRAEIVESHGRLKRR